MGIKRTIFKCKRPVVAAEGGAAWELRWKQPGGTSSGALSVGADLTGRGGSSIRGEGARRGDNSSKNSDAVDGNKRKCCLCLGTFKWHQNEIRIPV